MRGAFLRGAFTAEAARGSAAVLAAYGLGLLPMVLIRSAVASFQSRGDTTTPMLCFFAGLAVNLALKLALYQPLGPAGLALATAAGAWINFALLDRARPAAALVRARQAADRERRHRRFRRPAPPRSPRRFASSPPTNISAACRCCATNSTSSSPDCWRSSSMRSSTSWARSLSAALRESNCCNEKLGLPEGPFVLGGRAALRAVQGNSCRAARSSSSAPVTPACRPPPACARKARTARSSCSPASPTCPISARRCRRRSSRARWTSPACRCAPSSSIANKQIDLRLGVQATRIDRAARRVELGAGGASRLRPSHPRHRRAAAARFDVPGADLDGVLTPAQHRRRGGDPRATRSPARRVVVIGAGFIGLEIAATALALGGEVTVVEIARPLGRAVSPPTSDFFLDAHRAFGARFRLGVGVSAIEGADGAPRRSCSPTANACPPTSSSSASASLAEDALARAAGLACDNGVVVDALLVDLRSRRSRRSAIARSFPQHVARPDAARSNRCRTPPTRRAASRGG